MNDIASIAAWLLALASGAPLANYTLEVAVGLAGRGRTVASASSDRVVVLIPAHDEAAGIGATLDALAAVAPAADVLVVADNCADATAEVARTHGAEAIERHDAAQRGKGYALAYGRDHLASAAAPPAVVIVLDADCRLSPGSIETLAACCAATGRPAQAVNLIAPDPRAGPMTQISGFAMLVKNLYRSRGMQRLGGAALLTGTGMAFPWPLFARADLASGSLVEDLGLGIALTRAGHAPRLVEGARVSSAPPPADAALAQRTRWEHGFLDTLRRSALPLVGSGLKRGSLAELLLGLHLLVPPLALLLLLAKVALLVAGALTLIGANAWPAALLGAVLIAALAVTLAAWFHGGRAWLRPAALLRAPLYILWKLPIYLGFMRRRETEWKRTARPGE